MKVMICGSDKVYAIENIFVKHMRELGVEVSLFPATTIFHDYYYKSIFHKLFYRAGLSGIFTSVNNEFKKQAEAFNPDCIWIFKGMEIFPSSLEWARKRGIKLANYNPDNPFIFTGRGSGNENITHSLHLYDLHFTYSVEIKSQLLNRTNAKCVLLPFGYEISEHIFTAVKDQPEVVKTCFLGNPDSQRATFIQELANKGISIDVYGNNWNKFVRHDRISVFPPVYELALWKTLFRYRVQLNMMRVHNLNSHNMRSFEVPAIGGIMLAPDTTEHRLFFNAGTEIFLYSNADDCVTIINRLIHIDESEAAAIREAAHNKCIVNGYSYQNRAAQVIDELNLLLA